MRAGYKVNELLINILPDDPEHPLVCRAPSLPDCVETGAACMNSLVGCFGVSACLNVSRCDVSLPNCGASAFAGTCAEACATCDAGCSLKTCGVTDRSHPAVCTASQLGALANLKAQLTAEIALVEQREREISELSRPETIEEVDALEGRLKAALENLEARRNELGQS